MNSSRLAQTIQRGFVILLAGVVLAGCGGEAAPLTSTPMTNTPTPGPSPTVIPSGTPAAAPTSPAEAGAAVANAKAALAKQLAADPASIAVVGVTPHDWPTPALGCPQNGHAYTQVITPGFIIVLAAGGTQYTYHASRNGEVVTCPAAPTRTVDSDADRLAMYSAVADAFFTSEPVRSDLHAGALARSVVYIKPIGNGDAAAIPGEAFDIAAAHAEAVGLARVTAEEPGGAVVGIGAVGQDSAQSAYPREGPTIWMLWNVSGRACSFTGIGYVLTRRGTGWQAEQYAMSMC